MTEYIVIYWISSERNFEYQSFSNYDNSVGFAKGKKRSRKYDVIIVKKSENKYQLMDFGYSTIYVWQNRILNFLSIMLVGIISYLYYKFIHKK